MRLVTGKNTHHILEASFKGWPGACATPCGWKVAGCRPPRAPWATPAHRTDEGRGGIAVLDYGIGNLASAHKALVHLGADARLVTDPDDAAGAAGIVLPGVGAFGRCAEALRASGLVAVVDDALARGVPFLGICIGFQLLYEGSEEAPATPGLGVLDGVVRALPPG